MTWLLKILQGPNAGAEIELPEGVVTRIGRSMDCDVMLQDNRMADEAISLDPQKDSLVLTPLATGCRVGVTSLQANRPMELAPYTPFLLGGTVCCCGSAENDWPEVDLAPLFAMDTPSMPNSAPPEEAEAAPAPEEPPAPTEEELEAQRIAEEKRQMRQKRIRRLLHWLCWGLFLLFFLALAAYAAWWVWQLTVPEKDEKEEYQNSCKILLQSAANTHGIIMAKISDASDAPYRMTGNFATAADRKRFVATALRAYPDCILDLSDDETLRSAVSSALTGLTEDGVQVVSAKNRAVKVQGMMNNFSEWTSARNTLLKEVRHLEKLEDNVIMADEMCRRFHQALCAAGLNDLTVRAGKRQFVFAGTVSEAQKGTLLEILSVCSKYVPENVSVTHAVRWKDTTSGITYGSPAPQPANTPAGQETVFTPPPLPLPISGVMISPMKCLVLQDGSRCLEGGTTRNCTVLKINEDSAVISFNGHEYTWRP